VVFYLYSGCWNAVNAYDWTNDYGVNAGVGYDDNYRLTEDNEIDTRSSDIGGSISIQGATEISEVGLVLRARNRSFSESSIDDETSYNLALNTSRAGERLSSNFNLSFDQASTTQTELLDTGENRDGKRNILAASPGLSYQLDERNSVGTNLLYRDVTYDTVSLVEYTNTSIWLGWDHRLDETRSFTVSYVYSVYDPENDDTTDTNSVNLGYGFQTSEVTAYSFTLGVTDVDGPRDSTTGGTGSFNVNQQIDDRNNFTLSLSTSYEGSGRGNVREEDRINLAWNHALSDRSQATFSAEGVNTDDRDYLTFRVGYNYNYTPEVVLSASYRFRVRTEDEGDSFDVDSANSNTLLFRISYSPL
jgi:hypothetical protein